MSIIPPRLQESLQFKLLELASFCLLYSAQASDLISLTLFILTSLRTEDKAMPSITRPVWNILLSLGELVEPFLVFLGLEVQVPVEMVKVPSVTCVERVECSLPLESGEDGTEEPTSSKRDTPSQLPSQPQPSYPSSKPEVTELITSQNYHWSLATLSKRLKELKKPWDS